MRNLNKPPILNATNASTEFSAIPTGQIYSATFIAVFTDDSAAGTLKIQASNDQCPSGNLPSGWVPINWVDVPDATVTIESGETSMVPMPLSISYQWIRLVWARSDGAGTISIFINAQGF